MKEEPKIQIDQYGPDLPKIIGGKGQVSKKAGKIYEGTENGKKTAPMARSYVVSKAGGRHEKTG